MSSFTINATYYWIGLGTVLQARAQNILHGLAEKVGHTLRGKRKHSNNFFLLTKLLTEQPDHEISCSFYKPNSRCTQCLCYHLKEQLRLKKVEDLQPITSVSVTAQLGHRDQQSIAW